MIGGAIIAKHMGPVSQTGLRLWLSHSSIRTFKYFFYKHALKKTLLGCILKQNKGTDIF